MKTYGGLQPRVRFKGSQSELCGRMRGQACEVMDNIQCMANMEDLGYEFHIAGGRRWLVCPDSTNELEVIRTGKRYFLEYEYLQARSESFRKIAVVVGAPRLQC